MSRPLTSAAAVAIALSLLFALLLAMPGYGGAFAQASPSAPDAPGSISGRVTDDSGAPLAQIIVNLYRLTGGNYVAERQALTDESGDYRFALLVAGSYRLGFRDPTATHAVRYYPDVATLQDAQTIAVVGNTVTGIDVSLTRAGAIEGTIANADGSSVWYAEVAALTRSRDGWRRATSTWVYTSGGYSLAGLLPGSYAVCAFYAPYGGQGSFDPAVCYDDIVSAIDNAEPVTVTAGVTTTGIDLTIGVEGDGAAIGGAVRGQNGGVLPDVEVYLYQQDAWLNPIGLAMATTNENGHYVFRGLGADEYFVQFRDVTGPYLAEYYSDALSYTAATPITVTRKTERLDIDVELVLGGVITGQLRILGQEYPDDVSINLMPVESIDPFPPYSSIFYDRQSGVFRLFGVPAGRYRLTVYGFIYGIRQASFGGHYSADPGDPDTASVITVTPGAMLENIDVELGSNFAEGVIAGRVTASGSARPGIKVLLYPAYDTITGLIVELLTDADGRYMIGGLTDGSYRLEFSDPAGIYATNHYSNAGAPDGATVLSISGGQQHTGVDADLKPGGAIAGRLVLPSGGPAVGYVVGLWLVQPEQWTDPAPMSQYGVSNNDGTYRIAGLPAGTYRVCVSLSQGGVIQQSCYGAPPGWTVYSGADVPVRAGATTENIDLFAGVRFPHDAFLPLMAR